MDELRWFLLFFGLPVVIIGVVVYSRWQDWRQDGPPWRRRRASEEPFAGEDLDDDLRGDLEELDGLIVEQSTEAVGEAVDTDDGVVGASSMADTPQRPDPEPADPSGAPSAPRGEPEQASLFDPEPPATEASACDDGTTDTAGKQERGQAADTRAARGSVASAVQNRMRQALGGQSGEDKPAASTGDKPAEAHTPPDGEEKLIVLTVMAPDDAVFTGEALIPVLEECGLRYGEHRIYHRSLETDEGKVGLYSVANVLEPGCLDAEHMEDYTTPGVALFMKLPGPFDGLAAFEQMLQTARTLAERLGGELLDGRRCSLTQQSIEHLREELLEYRRRARLAARRAR